jgi:glycerol-3-phosphate acyltransferase PlsY
MGLARLPATLSAAALGYVVGTFPTADLVARRAAGGDVDLRDEGSGNPGTANALDVLGPAAGAAVLVGDVGKGALACALGRALGGANGAHVAGTMAVAGHCYPVLTGRRGGKGVATSVGQCLATFPAYFPIDAVVAVGTAAIPGWRRRAFAAIAVASACWVAGGLVWWRRGWPNAWGPSPSATLPAAALVSSAMIIQRFLAEQPSPES